MRLVGLAPIFLTTLLLATSAIASGGVCGNNVVELGETCDDGNHANGDACSSRCQVEASQTKEQQKCIVVLNGLTTKLVDTQAQVSSSCFKNAGRKKLRGDQSLSDCLVIEGERKSRSIAARIKVAQDGTPQFPGRTKCPETPNFGYADDEVIAAAALAETRAFLQKLIVATPEEIVVDSTVPGNKYAALCQLLLLKDLGSGPAQPNERVCLLPETAARSFVRTRGFCGGFGGVLRGEPDRRKGPRGEGPRPNRTNL